MEKKHKADEIVDLNDLEFDEDGDEFSGFWYYDPTSARIDVSRDDILKRRKTFRSPTNTWTIYVDYSENDVGVAHFYEKEYEKAVACYVKFAQEEDDEDVDTEYNVFEALERMIKENEKTLDFACSLYSKHFPGGKYESKLRNLKFIPKESSPSLLKHDDEEDDDEEKDENIEKPSVRVERKEMRIEPSNVTKPTTKTIISLEKSEDIAPKKTTKRTPLEIEIRFLKKRLRQIQRLELKPSRELNEDQKVKLSKKSAYSRRLKMLTK